MALINDLVAERSTGTGTGNLTLEAAAGGFRRFATVFGIGAANQFHYHARHTNAGEWETGRGYMLDADTFVRHRVLKSSNSDLAVDFSPGTKEVFCDLPADVALIALGLAFLVYNNTGSAISAGKLGSIVSFDGTEDLRTIALADNATDKRAADGYVPEQIENNTAGWFLKAGEITVGDLTGDNDGDPVFLSTSGDWAVGPPLTGITQQVGKIIDSSATGKIYFLLTGHQEVRHSVWQTSRTYFKTDEVIESNRIYRCNTNHTSDASSFATDAAFWDELSPASSGSATQIALVIQTPDIKSYTLIGKNGIAFDVDSITLKTSSGTGTADLEIDGTDITGCAAVSISSTETTYNATAARSLTTGGERLSLNITANSSMADLEVTVQGTLT